jgi:hypothetical protein
MIVWGTRLFGGVDKVPGICHVATKFFHVWYVPLVPTQSFVVIAGSETGKGWRGIPIDMNGKSVLAGYLRAATIVAAIISVIQAITAYERDSGSMLPSGLIFLGAAAMNLFMWRGRASLERAHELAGIMKLDPAAVDQLYASGFDAPKG